MKKLLFLSVTLGLMASAVADIQAPPGSYYNSPRKLSRGVSNILLCWTEIPAAVIRDLDTNSTQAFANGPIRGIFRTGARFGWGFYETFTFPFPNKGSYKQPYTNTIMKPVTGYDEWAPDVGFLSMSKYVRVTLY